MYVLFIGLFFACLFTFQLFPILITIAPALVRASVLILIHPGNFTFYSGIHEYLDSSIFEKITVFQVLCRIFFELETTA